MTAAKASRAERSAPAEAPAEQLRLPVVVCVIDGCEEPVLHRGLCAAHWEDPQRK